LVSLFRDRAGKAAKGCLGTIVIIVVAAYVGARVVPPWMRYEQFQDEMRANARFGTTLPDSIIRIRLVAQADTLGLPPDARRIVIRRRGGPPTITISADYSEKITLPIFGIKLLHFKPKAEEPL
jgi:hypothetical protein